jgi:hypothetical protein
MVAQRQQPIVTTVVVGEDRRLIVDLPPDTKPGTFMVMIAETESPTPNEPSHNAPINAERERLRTILLAKGKLGTAHMPPPGTVFPTEEEILKAGIMPPGTPSSEETLRELRSDE